jgi:putative membrane protein
MITNLISRKILLVSASAVLACAPAFACTGPTCPCETLEQALSRIKAIEAQETSSQAEPFNPQLLGDQEFVREALEDGAAKVQLGQLVQQKSQSDDIWQFGLKMMNERTQLSEQVIQRVAKLLGVQVPNGPSRKNKRLAAGLETLSGSQFDEAYIKAMVKYQKQTLKKFSAEADQAQDARVKIVAEQGTNLISKHLELIERIAESHNVVAENHIFPIGTN